MIFRNFFQIRKKATTQHTLVNMFSESEKESPTARTNGRGCVAYATFLNCSRSEGK